MYINGMSFKYSGEHDTDFNFVFAIDLLSEDMFYGQPVIDCDDVANIHWEDTIVFSGGSLLTPYRIAYDVAEKVSLPASQLCSLYTRYGSYLFDGDDNVCYACDPYTDFETDHVDKDNTSYDEDTCRFSKSELQEAREKKINF